MKIKILTHKFNLFNDIDPNKYDVQFFNKKSAKVKESYKDADYIFVHGVDLAHYKLLNFLNNCSNGKKNIVVYMCDGTHNGWHNYGDCSNVICAFSHVPFLNTKDAETFKQKKIKLFYMPNGLRGLNQNVKPISKRKFNLAFCGQNTGPRKSLLDGLSKSTSEIIQRGQEHLVLPESKICLQVGAVCFDKNNRNAELRGFTTGVPHRCFSSAQYGCVLLAKYDSLLADMYAYDEIIMFEDLNDCTNIVKKFINDNDFLQETVDKARIRVQNNHLVRDRFNSMINILQRYKSGLPISNKHTY